MYPHLILDVVQKAHSYKRGDAYKKMLKRSDKVKLHFLECLSQEMLAERIGHLGAVLSHLDPFVSTQDIEAGVLRHLTCGIKMMLRISKLVCFYKLMLLTVYNPLLETAPPHQT
jgi:hypothetical protein